MQSAITMRPSRVLEILRRGGTAFSYKSNLSCARVSDIAAMCGFDCLWADHEHTANDWAVTEQQIWAARAGGMDVLVRVARGGYSDYIRPLELDAAGIMVPHIRGADDAREVVRLTRFQPLGRRPIDGGNADGRFCAVPTAEYVRRANAERFVIVQIEDPEVLDEAEAIARVPGIDMLFFGPGDFSHGLNAPGQADHPEVARARELVAAAALKHGKFAGTVGAPDKIPALHELGYRFINIGSDVTALAAQCRGLLAAVDRWR